MLLAIRQQLLRKYPSAQLVMAPSRNRASQPIALIRQHGLLAKSALWRLGIQWGDLAALLPSFVRRSVGLVLDREIDVVIDAAGFAYGRPWPERNLEELASAARRWQRRGTALIMLPQAFGSFDTTSAKRNLHTIAAAAERIYARDATSLLNLKRVLGEHSSLRLAPDFTSLLPGAEGLGVDHELAGSAHRTVAIIPNARMLDRGLRTGEIEYLSFLSRCVEAFHANGLNVAIFVHGGDEDLRLAEALCVRHSAAALIREPDPVRLRALLGLCRGSVGSRYHALISCLSQGVPAFGTSWSHKYQALYEDYAFSDGLVDVLTSEAPRQIAALLANDHWVNQAREQLLMTANRQKTTSEQMWGEVFHIIDTRVAAGRSP